MAIIWNDLFWIKPRANEQPLGDDDIPLPPPPPPPPLRRSPPGYICWSVVPRNSYEKLCKIKNGNVWVLTKPEFGPGDKGWYKMKWKFQEDDQGVISTIYFVEKHYGTPVKYVDRLDTQNFSLVRARFSSISLYFILKLKTIGPKIRNKIWQKNVWNAIMPDTIYFSDESKAQNRSRFGLFFSNVITRRLFIEYLFDKDGIELIFR